MALIAEFILTAEQQIERMAMRWPSFAVLHWTPWSIVWRGSVTPLCCTYEVQIAYYAFPVPILGIRPLVFTDERKLRPFVEVLGPKLLARSPATRDAIPHVFPNLLEPDNPRLCLHMPDEWDQSLALADTTVPWAIEWLVAYEGWRATGEWLAGGHGTERRAA
jgi:hypothetical protein